MKISTKGRYGLRALTDLASEQKNTPISLAGVAQRQEISLNYLEQVFGILRRAGIIVSIKGAGGGYMLSPNSADLTLREILEVLEGPFSIADSENKTEEDPISRAISELLWEEMDRRILTYLGEHTLKELADRYRIMNAEREDMNNEEKTGF